jgi:hypothetical protein
MPDGEWAQCGKCARKGYGIDSFHPYTSEFFPTLHGKLLTERCKACADESAKGMHGIVPEREAA